MQPLAAQIVGIGSLYAIEREGRTTAAGIAALAPIAARALGASGIAVARVGLDRIGKDILEDLRGQSVDVTAVQTDPDLATPRWVTRGATARVDPYGAFDTLQWDADLEALGRNADAIITDACGRRHGQSRSTIDRLLISATTALKVIDLISRSPPDADGDRLPRDQVGNAIELCNLFLLDAVALRTLAPAASDAMDAVKRVAALTRNATIVLVPTATAPGAVATTRSLDMIPQPWPATSTATATATSSAALAAALVIAMVQGQTATQAMLSL